MTTKIPSRPERILPPHAPGTRIGLFGGTFDPPHQAHLGASLLAMKRLKLDSVWWLVTPGNPLKEGAKDMGYGVTLKVHDARQPLPFPDGSFDAIYSHMFFTMDFPAGKYALFCFIPDVKDGKPHTNHGMMKELTVGPDAKADLF